MSMLEVHNLVRKSPNVYAHTIKSEYKKEEKKLYIVCEGIEDLGYYGQIIKKNYRQLMVRKQQVGGKNNVIAVYKSFNWDIYDKNKILFFLDRDFSYWLREPQYIDENVYITDQYSFENDAVKVDLFIEILEDIYGFANATYEELDAIRDYFNERWGVFVDNSTYAMAAVLVSNCVNSEHLAKNVKIKKMLNIEHDKIWLETIKGQSYKEYLYNSLKLSDEHEEEILRFQQLFESDRSNYFVRGKWALCFMIRLLEYIMENAENYVPSLYREGSKKPKRCFQLTEDGTMAMLAPRIVPPESIEQFLNHNVTYA